MLGSGGRGIRYLWKADFGVYRDGGTLRVNVNGINLTLLDDELKLKTKSKQFKGQVPFIQQKNTVKFISDTPGTRSLTIVNASRNSTQSGFSGLSGIMLMKLNLCVIIGMATSASRQN